MHASAEDLPTYSVLQPNQKESSSKTSNHKKKARNRLMMRETGLEPVPEADIEWWEASILPLNYPRFPDEIGRFLAIRKNI